VVVIAILYYFPKVPRNDWVLRLAMGLEFGGALGNLVDRLTQGYVTDFISVGRFPVFNIADASISIGVVIMVLSLWSREKETNPSEQAGKDESAADTPGGPLPEDFRSE
jgi:signal peptidase II